MIPSTVAYQAPPSVGFSRQQCWSRLPFPSPKDLLNPEIKPISPALDSLPLSQLGSPTCLSVGISFHKLSFCYLLEGSYVFVCLLAGFSSQDLLPSGKNDIHSHLSAVSVLLVFKWFMFLYLLSSL